MYAKKFSYNIFFYHKLLNINLQYVEYELVEIYFYNNI